MSGATTALQSSAIRPVRLPGWLIGWALAAAMLIAGAGAEALRLDFSEPDNTMRLVQVRDLLAGQGWFDDVQHRLNPPEGVASHWARWIDAGIAAPIFVLRPFIGQTQAEIVTAFLWPLGLLAIFMGLVSRVCHDLAGERLGRVASMIGPILAALATPTMAKFAPGSFDHHNVVLVLAFAAMLGLMRMAANPRMGALAGAALGAALATAAESLPQVAAGVTAAGLLWLFSPVQNRRGFAWFGAGLALSSIVFFGLLVPSQHWTLRVTDAMSPAFLAIGLVAGMLATGLGVGRWSEKASLTARAGAAAMAGTAAAAVLVAACPELLNGGYATLSPEMKTLWLPQISETRSLAQVWSDNPGFALGFAGAAVAGLVAAAVRLRAHGRDPSGWIVLIFLVAGWGVFAWQIRGAATATAFAIPFGAWACARARETMTTAPRPRGLLAFAGVCAVSASAVWQFAGAQMLARSASAATLTDYAARSASADACLTREAVEPLAKAAPGVILNPFVTGPAILLRTHHSVLAAPYHRDGAGISLMMNAFRATPEDAEALLKPAHINYVLVCAGLPEMHWYAAHAASSAAEATLSARLARGEAPAWLEPVALGDTPIRLYRIKR